MSHVALYHDARALVVDDPLQLRESHFDALAEFGFAGEEQRGRDAQRLAQLALVPTTAPPLRTKAIDPPPARVGLRPEVQGRLTADAIRRVAEPLLRRVAALEQRDAARELRLAQIEAAHKSLGEVVLSDLELVAPRPPEPILDPPEPSLDPGPARAARRTH